MNYGICNLSNIPLRLEPNDRSEMISQLLFGDHFEVISSSKQWLKIKIVFDDYQGWIDSKQCMGLSKKEFEQIDNLPKIYTNDLVNFIEDGSEQLLPVLLGSRLPSFKNNSFTIKDKKFNYQGTTASKKGLKSDLIKTAFMYINVPYLWGGKTPFGIDCSGFSQMVYKINGFRLFRDAAEQANQGEVLSFIEESEPGDLAFFDNDEGNIIHVGIILANNHIIHASGKVRIDRLDQSGIYNADLKKHTHKLRVIKKII